jgi:hypothetical protein
MKLNKNSVTYYRYRFTVAGAGVVIFVPSEVLFVRSSKKV